jgi:hypothetical protein
MSMQEPPAESCDRGTDPARVDPNEERRYRNLSNRPTSNNTRAAWGNQPSLRAWMRSSW